MLSVTTILKWLEEDTTGLDIWQGRNDGKGNNAHHEHLLWYKTYRGTLCHYNALSNFEDLHDGEMWGSNEQEALHKMLHGPRDGRFSEASESMEDITYSVMKDHGWVDTRQEFDHVFTTPYCSRCDEPKDATDRCPDCNCFLGTEVSTSLMDVNSQDVEYFVSAFEQICDALDVHAGTVVAVEQFLIHDEYGYGGQCDLVYEDREGNHVMVDLKTSSGLRHKHRLQAVAYAKAVEQADDIPVDTIDRVEVWRIHPDSKTGTIHTNRVPDEYADTEWYTDDHWFVDKWGDFEYGSMDEMWDAFTDLIP